MLRNISIQSKKTWKTTRFAPVCVFMCTLSALGLWNAWPQSWHACIAVDMVLSVDLLLGNESFRTHTRVTCPLAMEAENAKQGDARGRDGGGRMTGPRNRCTNFKQRAYHVQRYTLVSD